MVLTATDVFYDDELLARRARTTLAGADAGVLFIGGDRGWPLSATPVEVSDDDGEPVLRWSPDLAVGQAIAAGRLATLVIAPNPEFGVRLTLSGRLVGARDGTASLRVEQVLVGCPHRTSGARLHTRQLNLDVYALAEPDLLAAEIPRVVRHLNTGHEAELRRAAGTVAGQEVLASWIARLSATGVELGWVDYTGGSSVVLPFTPPATTMAELGRALQAALSGASRP